MAPRHTKTPRSSVGHDSAATPARGSPQTNATSIQSVPEASYTQPKIDWSSVDSQTFEGFKVHTRKVIRGGNEKSSAKAASRKRKLTESLDQDEQTYQPNPFEGTELPALIFDVKPAKYWRAAKKYRKFTIGTETFTIGDTVFIKADSKQDPDPAAPVQGWVAKVLEVKAGDEQHVYIRVYWMYRPEDLPGGRKPYHSKNELIASDHMDILDATSVEGLAAMKHWIEDDQRAEVLDGDQMFWRQTLDVTLTGEKGLSKLPIHCVDAAPCNPDQLLVFCPRCKTWLHGPCLEQAAVIEACRAHGEPVPEQSTPAKRPRTAKAKKGVNGVAAPEPLFRAAINRDGKAKLMLTDLRPGKGNKEEEIQLKCLKCHEVISDETDDDVDTESEVGVAMEQAMVEQ